jgi:hypothetical protein
MIDWFARNEVALWWLGGASIVLFIGTLVAMPIVVSRMPANYFTHREPSPESWRGRHRALRVAIVAAKNVLGALLVIGGIGMLLLPGPGVLTVLVGISLLDFPGKRALELRIARERHVLRAINWMRTRAGRPPLEVPHDPSRAEDAAARGEL